MSMDHPSGSTTDTEPAIKIRIATDCSGLEAPILALRSLLPPSRLEHVFSSEIDEEARVQLQTASKPGMLFSDLTLRNHEEAPESDLYVAGFPCQPFSSAGRGGGFLDPRGTVFGHVAAYIKAQGPALYLLENVEGLLSNDHGRAWETVLHTLTSLETRHGSSYDVHWRLLNSRDNGVAQNRPRVYILGFRRDAIVPGAVWNWPRPLTCPPLEFFLGDRKPSTAHDGSAEPCMIRQQTAAKVLRVLSSRVKRAEIPEQLEVAMDIDASLDRAQFMVNCSPCLIRSRPAGYWLHRCQRRMTVQERLRLHGMSDSLPMAVGPAAMGRLLGNTMSQCVLERLLVRALPMVGLADPQELEDRWEARRV